MHHIQITISGADEGRSNAIKLINHITDMQITRMEDAIDIAKAFVYLRP